MKRLAILLSALAVVAFVATLVMWYAAIFGAGDDWYDAGFLTFIVTVVLGGGAGMAWTVVAP